MSVSLERWAALTRDKKILNIASELSRAKHWMQENDLESSSHSLERALELVDLTVETENNPSNYSFRRELLRFREALAGFYAHSSETEEDFGHLFAGLLNLNPISHS